MAFYLNAKLKAFSDYHTSIWKMFLVLSPLLGALFIAASVTMHHVSVKCTPSIKNLTSSLAYALQTRARVTQIFLKFVSAEPPLTNLVVLIAPPRPRCPPLNSHQYSHCHAGIPRALCFYLRLPHQPSRSPLDQFSQKYQSYDSSFTSKR